MEIATKLAQANDLVTQGKLQSEIARTLGVTVMTLHRWRTAELQLENSRLRRLVTDLLLEKVEVEEVRPKTKVRKKGRPLLGNRPMTSAERVRKHRARKRQAASRSHVGGYHP